jgi:hypothetical protein
MRPRKTLKAREKENGNPGVNHNRGDVPKPRERPNVKHDA